MPSVETGFAEINGARMYYEVAGVGETLTFVHAGVADRRLWNGQFEAFAPRFRVIRYDLRGYGRTTAAAAKYAHIDDLRDLLDLLGVERTALIGCSMGGAVALDFLLTYPERATALVMVCSTPSGYQMQGAPPPLILELIAAQKAGDLGKMADVATRLWGVGGNRKPTKVDAKFRALVREMSLIGFKNLAAGVGEERPTEPPAVSRLGEVRVPTLIIDGAEDNAAVHKAGEMMAEQIAGARRVVMADAAHLPSLEHPAEFTRILEGFLNEALGK